MEIRNNMRHLIVVMTFLLLIVTADAQSLVQDVISFGQTNYGGTARIQGLGGTQISLGGDISSAASNPAGLGFMRTSTFNFTPSFNVHNAEAAYLNRASEDIKFNFNFNQLGIALSNAKGDIVKGRFKGGTFAINLTRTNNLHSRYLFEGRNNDNSILDFFIADRNAGGGYGDAAFGKLLVTDHEVGNFDDANRTITTNDVENTVSIVEGFPEQSGQVINRGAEYQLNFSWGGNLSDILYFGGGLGIKSLRLRRKETFTETQFQLVSGDVDPVINSLSLEENKTIDGSGVNLTLGMIVRPTDFVRFGLSYTTPTYYGITEESEFSLGVNYNDYRLIDGSEEFDLVDQNAARHLSDITITEYGLMTPGKLSAGLSFFLGKYGFISGDADIIDYSGSRILSAEDFSPVGDNALIRSEYQRVVNLRLGGELRLENLRFRAGYSMMPSPLEGNYKFQGIESFSFGGGYRDADYYIDVVLTSSKFETGYSPYSVEENSPAANINTRNSNLAVTLGFNF